MDVSAPHHIITLPVDADVLRALAGVDAELTGRQVTELTRGGHSGTVYRSLERLTRLGLLHSRKAGRASLYRFNREHLAGDAVMALVSLRSAMLTELRDAIARLDPPPVSAALFGSAARGDGGPDSDLDIAIIGGPGDADPATRRAWDAQIDAMTTTLERRLGNRIGVHEIGPADAIRLAASRPPVVAEILADQVPLFGRPIAEILGDGSGR
ncbi:MAG: nucleotidyltransferase domain-containing protein [Thermoleophilia bacterium]|nr:nucleotidyltransferase domain-containing protein [Thermoleophilia bacterium]